MVLHSGGTYYSRLAVIEQARPLLDNTPPIPRISHMAGDSGYKNPSGFLPAGGAGNEGEMQLPAGSPAVGSGKAESKRTKKRKRTTTPDEGPKIRRTRRRRSLRLDSGEPTQVGIMWFGLAWRRPVTTPVLANPSHYPAITP